MYETPRLLDADRAPALEENAWIGPLLGVVLIVYGSAWAFCQANCGWGRVRSCSTAYAPPRVSVNCK